MFSFQLKDEFVAQYKDKKPPFGFVDAGGNSLGEITFIRTYSRIKPDGTKETWWEVCERVINGMYSIQKDWAKNNRLPWNDNKAQTSAKEAFDRMFHLKWTPPGRGLWVTGTEMIHERNIVAGLYNCFTGDTKAITKNGVVRLDEIVGEEQEVWADGGWHGGVVSEFSQSIVNRIQFKPFFDRSNHVITVDATEDHKWVLDDGTETTSLAVGDKVVASGTSVDVNSDDYHAGVIHGIVFGDGTRHSFVRSDGAKRFHVRLCGDRADEMKQYFGHITYPPSANGDAQAYVLSQKELKEFPVGEGADYVGGFIYGWLLADGNGLSEDGGKLDTQHVDAYSWLSDHAAYGGYVVVGHNYHQKPTNYGDRKNQLHRITLRKSKVFKVVSITELDIQPTYCFTVPGVGKFTLASGLITGNCSFISTGDMDHRDPGAVFAWVMDALMLGVGVGFDTRGELKGIHIGKREEPMTIYQIPDSREGWAESIRLLINSFLRTNKLISFDYSLIRPYGEPIKGFGGTASGPEPLIKIHRQIADILHSRTGEIFDARAIVDIVNLIGTCVVAGNVRRSATIALGDQNDADFLELKNYDKYPERAEWGWMSNNTVVVEEPGYDYTEAAHRIADNGEPGFLFLDTMQNYGRLTDAPDGKDWRVLGTNPSLIAGTRVYTTGGVFPIEQLEGQGFYVKNLNGEISEARCWKSGENEAVTTIRFKGGAEYTATPKHEWPVLVNGSWVKCKTSELKPGDVMKSPSESSVYPLGAAGTYDEGFAIGWNLGDGWQTDRAGQHKNVGLQIGFMVSDADRASNIDEKLNKFFASCGSNSSFDGKDEVNVNCAGMRNLFTEYGVQHKSIGLPLSVWDSEFSDEYRKGIVDGLLSSDGSASCADGRITFVNKSIDMINDVADLLGLFGVKTSIQKRTTTGRKAFPNHSAYDNEDKTFVSYALRIGGVENIKHFNSVFTLSRTDKQSAIDTLASRSRSNGSDTSGHLVVEALYDAGTADVWDISVYDKTHAFHLARVVTGNCAEISLESRELCNLVEIHLNRHDSIEDFLKTIKFAYLYAKSITLLPTHWPETNAVIQRNRRIGTSITGIAGFVDKHGLPAFREWAENGYAEIQMYDEKYSEWLGIRQSIRTTTVKPSGSVSLLSGSTPGVHWPSGGKHYLRAVRFANNDPILKLLKLAWYKVEDDLYSDNTSVVYFPVKTDMERSEKDVSIYEKIHLASEAQRYWSDNSVSVTVTFNPDSERDDIERVLKMYEGSLKTVSFLKMSNDVYPQMPYTEITQAEYEEYNGRLLTIDFSAIYEGVGNLEEVGSKYCDGDTCTI